MATDTRTLQPAIWMVLVAALLDMMAMGIVMPVLPGLIAHLTGSIETAGIWTGMIGSLWAVMQLIAAPVIGALSDRYGRRPVILISTAGLSLDWVLMACAPNLWWLVVGRIIGGITSASGTALFACVADVTPAEARAKAFGMVGAAVSAGFVIGPALGGVLGEIGPRAPFWAAAGFSAAAFVYGVFVLPETLPASARAPFAWRRVHPLAGIGLLRARPGLGALAASGFLLTFTHRLFMTVFVLFAWQRFALGPLEVGLLLAGSSVLDFMMQGVLVGPVTARLGERMMIVLGLGIGGLGLLAMGLAPSLAWFLGGMLVNALWGLAEPTIRAALSGRVSDGEQGQLQGAVQSLASIAGITGPLFFGWLYGATSHGWPGASFVAAAAILAVAAILGARRD
jgi:DHA1 family tetracycline resistance protein-like MFS transporter